MATDMISGIGGSIGQLFGSDDPPKAILNRFAAPTAKAGGTLSTDLLTDVNRLSKDALDQYMAAQPRFLSLAGQQEGVLSDILGRRMAADPNALLQQVGNTAFGFINPAVIDPLARMDVNRNILQRRAAGLNPASVDSTADRLRNARIASGRYLDASQQVLNTLPNLYGQAFNQQQANEATAAGIVPQIASAYEGVFARPTTGLLSRIGTANTALGAGGTSIGNINAATQGFQQPRNFADRLAGASQEIGSGMSADLGRLGSLAGSLGGGGSL